MFFERKNIRIPDNDGEVRTCLEILKECGYNDGLCQLLVTHPSTGIIGDERDLKRRRNKFGKNDFPLPGVTSFWDLLA